MPDPYVIISGGNVQNDPDRHIFDLDSLEDADESDAWAFLARVAKLASSLSELRPTGQGSEWWRTQRSDFTSMVAAALGCISDFEGE